MDKITSDKCKAAIVQWCEENIGQISKQFCDTLSLTQLSQAAIAKNWKRHSKERMPNVIKRQFSCKPYNEQLWAYVTTDLADTEILIVEVNAE